MKWLKALAERVAQSAWVKATAVRAVRSGAQAVLLVTGTTQVKFGEVDWELALSSGLGMAIAAVLTAIAFPPPEAE